MGNEVYKQAFDIHGESPKSLHWLNYESQAIRFKQLTSDLNFEGKTILDAGCGMGDLLPFIYAKADHFNYLGIDINEDFIAVAKKRYQGHRFKVGDAFSGRLKDKFDIVITSGTLNHNQPNWLEWRLGAITNLFDTAKEALAFNMAGGFEKVRNNHMIAYAPAQQVIDFCEQLTPKLKVKADYNRLDFTIIMFK